MALQIKHATKTQSRLRMGAFGPSGAGKTMTSLRIATGLGGKIGVIDTERGSAAKYSDRWPFDVIELPDHSIDTYIDAIHAFAKAEYDVLIIDSISHAWEWLLDFIDKLGKTKYKGNKWSAWSEGTPKQQQLVDAILQYPGHVIATMRSKTEWVTEQNDRGKSTPVRIGVAPRQRDGVEYEFDVLLEMNVENVGRIIKDRTGKFQDAIIEKPGEEFGQQLAEWLSSGAPAVGEPLVAEPTRQAPKKADAGEKRSQGDVLAQALSASGLASSVHLEAASKVLGAAVEDLDALSKDDAHRLYQAAKAVKGGETTWGDYGLSGQVEDEFPADPPEGMFDEEEPA